MTTTTATVKGLPSWMLPTAELRTKSWPEWSHAERSTAPAGLVWDRDGQRWTR